MSLIVRKLLNKGTEDLRKNVFYLPSSEAILDNITNGFFILDQNWCIKYTNKQMENFVGKNSGELIGYNIWDVFPETVGSKFYHFYHKAMEEQIPFLFEDYYEPTKEWLEVRVKPSNEGLIGYVYNITDRKLHEQTIEHMAYHDDLTDLPNRRFFEKKLHQLLEQSIKNNDSFALLYLDIDRLKKVNDTLGHSIGDQLIKKISYRLVRCIDNKGFVAHLGGDEFAILLYKQFASNECVQLIAKDIINSLGETPFQIQDNEFYTTTSVGISYYPQHGQDIQSLVRNADIALYRSKEKGRNNYTFYNPQLDIYTFKRFSLEKDLRVALEENKLEVHYQPRVNTKTGKIISAESLVRWNHPEWGMVLPDEFISIAEETGIILPLTLWVLRTVCKQIQLWHEQGIPFVPISINVPARHFSSKYFINEVKQILKETLIEGNCIEIEITETSILEDPELVESTIKELRLHGVKVALDDFGRGYSSLSYLTQFKVDVLKIDRCFIRNVTSNQSDAAIVRSIIHLAHGLGIKVVAEGVETMEQLDFLKQQSCDEIQGFLLSRPVLVTEFQKLLDKAVLIPSKGKDLIEFENRRKYFRVNLNDPLSSKMTIIKIRNKDIRLGNTEVVIEDIGVGGLRCISNLSLAVNEDIILKFETEILGETIIFCGYIVWKQEIDKNIFRYGLEFKINENEQNQLIPLLNHLALKIKKGAFLPDTRLVNMEKFSYLKNIVTKASY